MARWRVTSCSRRSRPLALRMRQRMCGCCSATSRCCVLPGVSFSCRWRSRTTWSSAVCGGRPASGGRGAGAVPGNGCAQPGELTPARLAQASAPLRGNLSLRFVQRPLGWREFRAWRHTAGRPRLAAGSSRLAAVGLLGLAHRRGDAVVAAAARAGARRHRSGGRADLPVTGRPGQLPVLRPGHPRPGFRCVAVLVLVRDERLAVDLRRCQRPRGRLGAGHRVPAGPAGSVRPAGLGGVLLP